MPILAPYHYIHISIQEHTFKWFGSGPGVWNKWNEAVSCVARFDCQFHPRKVSKRPFAIQTHTIISWNHLPFISYISVYSNTSSMMEGMIYTMWTFQTSLLRRRKDLPPCQQITATTTSNTKLATSTVYRQQHLHMEVNIKNVNTTLWYISS